MGLINNKRYWREWFAWYPVRTDFGWVWLDHVSYRRVLTGKIQYSWDPK